MKRITTFISGLAVLFALGVGARGATVFDNSGESAPTFNNVTSNISGEDFAIAQSFTLTSLSFFLSDNIPNDDGVLNTFGGVLSFAIYDDSGPGGLPGSIPVFTINETPTLTDTGLSILGADVVRADITLSSGPTLSAGTHWVVPHEGNWLSSSDGSDVWWATTAANASLYDPWVFSIDETSPAFTFQDNRDLLMIIEGNSLTSSIPEPSTTLLIGIAALAIRGLRSRRGTSQPAEPKRLRSRRRRGADY